MRRFLKWSGIGCGGLLFLFVVLMLLSASSGSKAPTPVISNSTPASVSVAIPTVPTLVSATVLATAATTLTTVTQPTTNPPAAPTKPAPALTPTAIPVATLAKPAAIPAAAVGQRIESAGIALTVNTIRKSLDSGQFLTAKPGRAYLIADVTLENSSREKAPYNPLYFKVKDGDGYESSASLFPPDSQGLKSGEMAAGEKVRGTIAFEIAGNGKGFLLSYQPLVIFGGYQVLRVNLGD